MRPADARVVVSKSPVWADIQEAERREAQGPSFRVERIAVPDPPDAELLERMREAFRGLPRIVEVYLVGEHLIPEDGSHPFDNSSVVLLLDPPDDRESRDFREEVAAAKSRLAPLGWDRPPARTWGFVRLSKSRHLRMERSYWRRTGELIYERQ